MKAGAEACLAAAGSNAILQVHDDGGDPERAAANIRAMAGQPHVLLLLGGGLAGVRGLDGGDVVDGVRGVVEVAVLADVPEDVGEVCVERAVLSEGEDCRSDSLSSIRSTSALR